MTIYISLLSTKISYTTGTSYWTNASSVKLITLSKIALNIPDYCFLFFSVIVIFGAKYSRIDQVKFMEDRV